MKVLIVDDSEIVRERLKDILSEVTEGEAIGQAKDTPAAMEMLHKLNPEVVILNIEMPGRSGIDLLHEIKTRKSSPLVIVLTSQSYSQYRKVCIKTGADFIFDQSTELDKVIQVIKQLSKKGDNRTNLIVPALGCCQNFHPEQHIEEA